MVRKCPNNVSSLPFRILCKLSIRANKVTPSLNNPQNLTSSGIAPNKHTGKKEEERIPRRWVSLIRVQFQIPFAATTLSLARSAGIDLFDDPPGITRDCSPGEEREKKKSKERRVVVVVHSRCCMRGSSRRKKERRRERRERKKRRKIKKEELQRAQAKQK